ncbi:MAG: class I SAM-dependent methyltransferase [Candidatus Edwardsbacteria bacterium]|nr:class I SAM-dependent methyltransferase [Candidatus Edwardsbacteria bacterium]MBU1575838.1 class I SAM-dependent methyltransferase [Candidatus Edwardsbacteria bacterium]MBU2463624.1 class I SAM-dependent methyltransferase [Candidatus Edwardsbacteria bacterium]MBU2593052.1 class I SAM-dependent methyltransferase [Candidatus Edwardsbacteria bacterium]
MSRNLNPQDLAWWHQRYVRQAEWTRALRLYLYRRLEIARCKNILEIGSGTGVIAGELAGRTDSTIYGLDSDTSALDFAQNKISDKVKPVWLAGDAEKLPFGDESVDLIVTHYFWLWARHPDVVCNECRRVLKKGGKLAVLAEPDYSARQDFPGSHPSIKEFLMTDLAKKGADPDIGKKLGSIFAKVGLKTIVGSVNDKITFEQNPELFRQEWNLLHKLGYPREALESMEIMTDDRGMIMPVHWAIGRKM